MRQWLGLCSKCEDHFSHSSLSHTSQDISFTHVIYLNLVQLPSSRLTVEHSASSFDSQFGVVVSIPSLRNYINTFWGHTMSTSKSYPLSLGLKYGALINYPKTLAEPWSPNK